MTVGIADDRDTPGAAWERGRWGSGGAGLAGEIWRRAAACQDWAGRHAQKNSNPI